MHKKILVSLLIGVWILTNAISPIYAATIRTGDSTYIPESEKNLKDLYLFGNTVSVDAPISNDLITAGNSVTINGNVSGSLMGAGNDVVIRSHVHNALRVAGSNVTISGAVDGDLLAAGGTVRLTNEASVSGDLLLAGGDIQIDAPIKGNVRINGGTVVINAPVGGNIDGTIGELTLGPKAKIGGNLIYSSDQKATVQPGATVSGRQEFKQIQASKEQRPQRGLATIISGGSLYKLAVDIIITFLVITFIPMFIKEVLERAINTPTASAGVGLFVLVFLPLISLFLFFLLWLGLASFLFYGLLLVLSLFIGKLLIGWWLLRWWYGREKKEYILDWKVSLVGPAAVFIIAFIPILGLLGLFVVYLITLGALTKSIIAIATNAKPLEIGKNKV